MQPETSAAVQIRGLSKTYQPSPSLLRLLVRTVIHEPVAALRGVDLDVREGSICALVGPNGAGKTTMFRILMGLTTPTSGSAHVLGFDTKTQPVEVRRLIGWMPADYRTLFLRLTCHDNLYFHGRMHGMTKSVLASRIPRIMEQVGIPGMETTTVFGLSAGQRARLQLARTLLPSPRVIVLDEPTGAVDPVAAHELLGLIKSVVAEQRLAAIISSHRLEEIEALPEQIVMLDRGRLLYDGPLGQLRRQYELPQVELELPSPDLASEALTKIAAAGHDFTRSDTVLVGRLKGDATAGELLMTLGDGLAHVRHVRQRLAPLRDLLAQMYAPAPTGSRTFPPTAP